MQLLSITLLSLRPSDAVIGIRELGNAKVVLDDGKMYGSVAKNGAFRMYAQPSLVYSLAHPFFDGQTWRPGGDIPSLSLCPWSSIRTSTPFLSCLSYVYSPSSPQLRIDIPPSHSTPEVRPYAPGTPLNPPTSYLLPYPILLTPRAKNEYFIPREGFNLIGMFQNPMMLMMGFAAVMMLGMPYIMVSAAFLFWGGRLLMHVWCDRKIWIQSCWRISKRDRQRCITCKVHYRVGISNRRMSFPFSLISSLFPISVPQSISIDDSRRRTQSRPFERAGSQSTTSGS